MNKIIAHVKQLESGNWIIQSLMDHLTGTAFFTQTFVSKFGEGKLGYALGLFHDLGKSSTEFQFRIKGLSGYDPEAHISQVDHSTAGGIFIRKLLPGGMGELLAFPIICHHTGLQNLQDMLHRLSQVELLSKLEEGLNLSDTFSAFEERIEELKGLRLFSYEPTLFIRMLFSALVDADSLDTEAFMNPKKAEIREVTIKKTQNDPSLEILKRMRTELQTFLRKMETNAPDTSVNRIRQNIKQDVISRANLEPGFFSLTVPTGGGKTLTSLAFALEHAQIHQKRRILYVIPFTTIIEQTADVFRKALGNTAEFILEHHSNLEPEKETAKTLLLSENWDAPLIVTTNVQFYESLFASKRSRARKIHNIANSVIILDECQTIPPDFVNPILSLLKELVKNYGVTVIFCSATPIAFRPVQTKNLHFEGVEEVRELVADPEELAEELKRFELELPVDWKVRTSLSEIAERVNDESQALVIVNRKADAREIYNDLEEPKAHLSTWMCPVHRKSVLDQVKSTLKNKESIRLVSTQLIEAGVDIDFPVVFRSASGLDSILQAGGRCNRDGRMEKPGRVIVFQPEKPSPPGYLRSIEEVGKMVLQDSESKINPAIVESYFEKLFWKRGGKDGGDLDRFKIKEKLQKVQFADVAALVKLIPEEQIPVLVPYGEGKDLIKVIRNITPDELNRPLLRKIQQYSVSLPLAVFEKFRNAGSIETLHNYIHILINDDLYNNESGLFTDDPAEHNAENLIF